MSAHIVVDVRMAEDSGVGTYIRNTVPRLAALEPDWRFTLMGDRARLADSGWARIPGASVVHCAAGVYSVREQFEIPARVPSGADLFWSPHYNVPAMLRVPLVVTVHDLAHLRLPEHTSSPIRQAYARLLFGVVQSKARAVMCDSQFTLNEYRALVGEPKSVTVVHCGVDASWFELPETAPPMATPYFLFVGNLKPHKNARLALEAMVINAGKVNASLVLIGRTEGMRTRDESLGPLVQSLTDRVTMLGEVDEGVLRRYVQHAVAVVQPSLYEGFGLPPLEAMAAGTPAIVSTAGSLPEICGDGALYFDPRDAHALASAMARVASDTEPRDALRVRGKARARRFDWGSTAAAARATIASVLQARHAA